VPVSVPTFSAIQRKIDVRKAASSSGIQRGAASIVK